LGSAFNSPRNDFAAGFPEPQIIFPLIRPNPTMRSKPNAQRLEKIQQPVEPCLVHRKGIVLEVEFVDAVPLFQPNNFRHHPFDRTIFHGPV